MFFIEMDFLFTKNSILKMSCAIHWISKNGNEGHGEAHLTREIADWHAKYMNIPSFLFANPKDTFHYVIDHEVARVISEICVTKGLPGGDPCWMAAMIASYLHPIPKTSKTK